MSKAFKCDRCGELYEGYEGYVKFTFAKPDPKSGKKQDLCYDCKQSLHSWWKGDVEL
jgi:hypothetical protein